MTMKRSLIGLAALLALVVGAWSGWWYYSGRVAIGATLDWMADQRDQGYDIGYAKIDLGGYPFHVELTIDRPGIAAPSRFWSVSAEQITISYAAWQFDHFTLTSEKPVQLIAAAIPGSRQEPVVLQRLMADYWRAVAATPHQMLLVADTVTGPNGLSIAKVGLSGRRGDQPALDAETTALEARLELIDADIQAYIEPGLPGRVDAALVDFAIAGPEVPGDGSLLKKLAEWRDQGGAVDVTDLSLVWGDLNLQGAGLVTLDEEMRPLASFEFKTFGLSETAKRFEEAGLIDAATRRIVDLAAGLLSFGRRESGAVNISVSSQDGQLYLGPVAVAEVPSLIPGYNPPPQANPAPIDTFPDLPPPPTVSDDTLNADRGRIPNGAQAPDPVPNPVPSQ